MTTLSQSIEQTSGKKMRDVNPAGSGSNKGLGLGRAIRSLFGGQGGRAAQTPGLGQSVEATSGKMKDINSPQHQPWLNDRRKKGIAQALAFVAEYNGAGQNTPSHQLVAQLGQKMQAEQDAQSRVAMVQALKGMGRRMAGGEHLSTAQLQRMIVDANTPRKLRGRGGRGGGKLSRARGRIEALKAVGAYYPGLEYAPKDVVEDMYMQHVHDPSIARFEGADRVESQPEGEGWFSGWFGGGGQPQPDAMAQLGKQILNGG